MLLNLNFFEGCTLHNGMVSMFMNVCSFNGRVARVCQVRKLRGGLPRLIRLVRGLIDEIRWQVVTLVLVL